VRQLVFDKTGTLTLENPLLENPADLLRLDPTARSALLALVRDNPHPVSQCLLENLLSTGSSEALPGDVQEHLGQGVSLGASGHEWRLGRAEWTGVAATAADGTCFARDGVALAQFRFIDAARPDARTELAALDRLGYDTFILSGDHQPKVAKLAVELGLPPDNALGDCTPQEKADWLGRNGAAETLMLGDGANDSLAFDQALCRGTPVIHRGHLEQKADFYYLGRGIAGLRALFVVNATRRRAQLLILVFSIVYNTLAVGLAVAGRMNPLIAAILMPVNSLLTLALVSYGMRSAFRSPRPAAGA